MELVEMPRNLSDDCHWMTTKPPPLGMRQPNGFLERMRRRRRKDDFHFSKRYLLFQERVYHIYFPAVHANFSWIFQKHFGANFYRTSCVQLEREEGEGWEGEVVVDAEAAGEGAAGRLVAGEGASIKG